MDIVLLQMRHQSTSGNRAVAPNGHQKSKPTWLCVRLFFRQKQKLPGFLVNEVAPLVGDMLVGEPQLLDGLPIMLGTRLHPAQASLNVRQLFPFYPVRQVRRFAAVSDVNMGNGVFQSRSRDKNLSVSR